MKNKKKIFSPALYLEGLRQLKIIGILAMIIYLLEAVLIAINQTAAYKEAHHSIIIGINAMHPAIYFTYTVLAPIFTLYLFGFLTRRDSSDFYHSIPHRRTCIYVSYFAAIITWLFSILLISTGVSILLHACQPDIYKINYAMTLPQIAGILIASLGVVSAVALAQSITGTLFTNIVVSGIILFFPRIMIKVILENILSKMYEIVPGEYFLPALNGKYNLITGIFTESFSGRSIDIFISHASWIYTFILAVIYFGAGLICFNRRHSESAGNAAPNRWLQAVYRMCFTLIFCLIPISMICEGSCSFTEVFSVYCIAVVIYFLFEIVTTKSVRSLLKILPGLFVMALLNAGIIFLINTTSEYQLNKCPEASDVSYVRIMAKDTSYTWGAIEGTYKYFDIMTEQLKIDDKEVINAVIRELQSDIKLCNNDTLNGGDSYLYQYEKGTFAIHLKNGKTYYRNISIDRAAPSQSTLSFIINDYLAENIENEAWFQSLPPYKDVTVNTPMDNASGKQKKALYNAFVKDYDRLTTDERLEFWEFFEREPETFIGIIDVSLYTNGKYSSFGIPVLPEYENTFKTYLGFFYKESYFKNTKMVLEDIEDYVARIESSVTVDLEYNDQSLIFSYYYNDNPDSVKMDYEEQDKAAISRRLADLAELFPKDATELKENIMDADSFIKISVYIENSNSTSYVMLPVTDSILEIYDNLEDLYEKQFSKIQ